jgi:hypothetical protein
METVVAGEQERQFYELRAGVAMPHHVHLPILPKVGVPVITQDASYDQGCAMAMS